MKKSEDNRNSIDDTPLNDPVFCDSQLSEGWYRFVTAVRTRNVRRETPYQRAPMYYSLFISLDNHCFTILTLIVNVNCWPRRDIRSG